MKYDPKHIHLTPRELSERQKVSLKKLAHDRMVGGPDSIPFYKFGRLCRYCLDDVLRWEAKQMRTSTSDLEGDDA